MKHMKKLLSLVLALALCLSLAVPALAEDSDFEITGTTLKKYKGPGGDVVIPDGITTIATWAFSYEKTLTSVTMPDSVTSIGKEAFISCEALKNVYFSNNVTSIGDSAFSHCSSLTSVTLPGSVTSIGSHAFANCSSMKSLTLPGSLISMGTWAFTDCTSLTSISVPGSVSVIPTDAFSGCTSVKNIIIYEGVTKIEANAFRNCPGVTGMVLPASLKEAGTSAFADCKGLRNLYYGGSEEQWDAIKSMRGATSAITAASVLDNATIHYNSPMPEPAPGFTDVSVREYYAAPVAWAAGNGIANGTGGNNFSPNETCTQAQILTFLYREVRNAGSAVPVAASAADMDAAVDWALSMGMIDASFEGGALCTRATAVTYIWQAFGSPDASASSFNDVPAGTAYAASVSWAVQKGVTNGTGDGNFSPDTTCTRGQIVTFLYRAYI